MLNLRCDDGTDDRRAWTTARRTLLKYALGLVPIGAGVSLLMPVASAADALTREQRDALTPEHIIELMKEGNRRFREGKMKQHNYVAQKRATVGGQYPAAAILSCIDSRAPAEILLDAGIGHTFNARIAGNISNDDLLGSLEFACAIAGAKVIMVMGHTSCGAIKGAIDGAELGHLTGLLERIKPAIAATSYTGERRGSNAEFVDAVARTNVKQTVESIRRRSTVLAKLENEGKIKMIGSMYHLDGGEVEFS
jgi:carbonic anhydrase